MTRLLFLLFVFLPACAPPSELADTPTDAGVVLPGDGGAADVGIALDAAELDAPDAARLEDAPSGYTPEGFARAAGALICEAWARCPRCTLPPGRCTGEISGSPIHDPADFDPERVDAYLALLEEAYAACEQVSALEHAAMYPYWGDGEPGDPPETGALCTSPDDCTTRNCQALGGVRRCVALPADAPRGSLCL